MRYVQTLKLHNWGPFRGSHSLELGPTIYAVMAEHQDDPERSNWIGKTWFLQAMLFVLTGIKPDSCRSEDDWITRGEGEGFIELITDDGSVIKRSRKRERSTQLQYIPHRGGLQKQAVAQASIYDAMGLNGEDLLATAFIQQGQISRLVTADPATRMNIVNGWLELGPLQRAEAWLRGELNRLVNEDRSLAPERAFPGPHGQDEESAGSIEEITIELVAARSALWKVSDERDGVVRQGADLAEWQRHQHHADDLEETRRVGKLLVVEVTDYKPEDMDALGQRTIVTAAARGTASDREAQLRELLHGDWDGDCPLTCEACPVKSEVEMVGVSMATEHGESEIVLDEADAAVSKAHDEYQAAMSVHNAYLTKALRLAELRAKAEKLLPSAEFIRDRGEAPGPQEMQAVLYRLNTDVSTCERAVSELEASLTTAERAAEAAERSSKRRQELDDLIRIHREAIAVVGRQGAQREIAERALGKIEFGANQLLTKAGIDLQMEVRWAREGRGLASHCDSCGTAFGTSRKVKACGICGAERGPKLVEKLDILPSDRSGAADDIGGLSFQLAASAWLRTKRSAAWASVCIDEPFGALDRANCNALSTHLHAMIRGNYAFEQGFLVAHDDTVMHALPARIQIYGGADGAEVQVIQ